MCQKKRKNVSELLSIKVFSKKKISKRGKNADSSTLRVKSDDIVQHENDHCLQIIFHYLWKQWFIPLSKVFWWTKRIFVSMSLFSKKARHGIVTCLTGTIFVQRNELPVSCILQTFFQEVSKRIICPRHKLRLAKMSEKSLTSRKTNISSLLKRSGLCQFEKSTMAQPRPFLSFS